MLDYPDLMVGSFTPCIQRTPLQRRLRLLLEFAASTALKRISWLGSVFVLNNLDFYRYAKLGYMLGWAGLGWTYTIFRTPGI
jgi:hypothetical protein